MFTFALESLVRFGALFLYFSCFSSTAFSGFAVLLLCFVSFLIFFFLCPSNSIHSIHKKLCNFGTEFIESIRYTWFGPTKCKMCKQNPWALARQYQTGYECKINIFIPHIIWFFCCPIAKFNNRCEFSAVRFIHTHSIVVCCFVALC